MRLNLLVSVWFTLSLCLFRAFAGMLDHIIVEIGGVKMPLNHLALVSVLDPKTLSVNPYDPDVSTNTDSFSLD